MKKFWLIICVIGIGLTGCQKKVSDDLEIAVPVTEIIVQAETESMTETEAVTEAVTEVVTGKITEIVTETETEQATETEEVTETEQIDISAYVEYPYDLEKSKALFEMVNQVRIDNGLQPLEWDDHLYITAAIRAEEATRHWSHTRPDGSKWSTASDSGDLKGENLAKGYGIDDVTDAWMASPTHKENILREEFRIGAIAYYDKDGFEYWAEHFGY